MDRKLENLLKEQNFKGKTVCLFASDPDVETILKRRMVGKIEKGKVAPAEFFLFWLWKDSEKKSVVKSCFDNLGSKGKVLFFLEGKEHQKLKDWLWEVGFLITRHFSVKTTPTSGATTYGAEKAECLFLVAEKLNF
jgi:hypothetical protein